LDSGFNFDYSEFGNTDERTAECIGYTDYGELVLSDVCDGIYGYHGYMVSDVAGGKKHGVAKKANIYGLALSHTYSDIHDGDLVGTFQYIYETMRPYKTIINTSFRKTLPKGDELEEPLIKLINKITQKGGIVVSASDNHNSELDITKSEIHDFPCTFDDVICVGGMDNHPDNDMTEVYQKIDRSNYGPSVDIYAPSYAVAEYVDEYGEIVEELTFGNSFATPMVAGVIATIMSENPNTKFTKDTMLKKLIGLANTFVHKKKTCYMLNNGKHIVYSKDGVYYGCGINAGNTPCTTTRKTTTRKTTTTTKKTTTTTRKTTTTTRKTTTTTRKTTTKKTTTTTRKTTTKKTTTKKTTTTTSSSTSTKGRCGPSYGKCTKNNCCSKYDWCGTSDKHCYDGCQPKYGLCKS